MNAILYWWDDYEYILLLANDIGVVIILVGSIIGSIILLRRDRSIPSIMMSVGGVMALFATIFESSYIFWLTDGTFSVGEEQPEWQYYLAIKATCNLLKIVFASIATIGFIYFAAKQRGPQE